MNRFYIKSIRLYGNEKKPSIIDFKEGLNIVHGPINTGKSIIVECINYMLSSEETYFDSTGDISKLEYTNILLLLSVDNNLIALSKKIGDNQVEVEMEFKDARIKKTYKVVNKLDNEDSKGNKTEESIDIFFLNLMNIDKDILIRTSNESYNKKKIMWKYLLHLFLLNDRDIQRDESPVASIERNMKTRSITSLIYLLAGKTANDLNEEASNNKAVRKYIKDKKDEYEKKLRDKEREGEVFLVNDINLELEQLKALDSDINDVISSNEEMLPKLHEEYERLAECNTLLISFKKLKESYELDVSRLEFIIDGINAIIEQEQSITLGEEENNINSKKQELELAVFELEETKKKLISLMEVCSGLEDKKMGIQHKIDILNKELLNQKNNLMTTCKQELEKLRGIVNGEKLKYQNKKDILFVKKLLNHYSEELAVYQNSKIVSVYDMLNDQLQRIDDQIKRVIKYAGITNEVSFNKDAMDIEIDGKKKKNYEKGRANSILNTFTVMAIASLLDMSKHNIPNFHVLDSPLTIINEDKLSPNLGSVLKKGLMKYLTKRASSGSQIILFERTDAIPEEYRNVKGINYIKFTGSKTEGRYGFLNGVENPER